MKSEIKKSLEIKTREADRVVAEAVFPPDFPAFRGHFPGRPVLPGICLAQAAVVLAEELCGGPLVLREIVSAKFLSIVEPDRRVQFNCSFSNGVVRTEVACGSSPVAQLKLKADRA